MSGNVQFGIVAALEREVRGIVRGWNVTTLRKPDGNRRIYRGPNAALICAGTGTERAYAAAQLLVEVCAPKVLISIGFAGACTAELMLGGGPLKPGASFVPATVTDAANGKRYATSYGSGNLATVDRVADRALKQSVVSRFGAQVVDMEAAGVAAAASEHGCGFVAIKAISDGVEEDLGFLADFVKPMGFRTGRFIAHIALRPGLWPRVAQLQVNSELAAKTLKESVNSFLRDTKKFAERYSTVCKEF